MIYTARVELCRLVATSGKHPLNLLPVLCNTDIYSSLKWPTISLNIGQNKTFVNVKIFISDLFLSNANMFL